MRGHFVRFLPAGSGRLAVLERLVSSTIFVADPHGSVIIRPVLSHDGSFGAAHTWMETKLPIGSTLPLCPGVVLNHEEVELLLGAPCSVFLRRKTENLMPWDNRRTFEAAELLGWTLKRTWENFCKLGPDAGTYLHELKMSVKLGKETWEQQMRKVALALQRYLEGRDLVTHMQTFRLFTKVAREPLETAQTRLLRSRCDALELLELAGPDGDTGSEPMNVRRAKMRREIALAHSSLLAELLSPDFCLQEKLIAANPPSPPASP